MSGTFIVQISFFCLFLKRKIWLLSRDRLHLTNFLSVPAPDGDYTVNFTLFFFKVK